MHAAADKRQIMPDMLMRGGPRHRGRGMAMRGAGSDSMLRLDTRCKS